MGCIVWPWYTIATILIGQNFNLNSSFSIVLGIAGAYLFNGGIILEQVYWKFNTLSQKANLDPPDNRPRYSNPGGIFNNYLR